jgi:DNA-binding FadR family transcriptional regulator
MNQMTRRPSLFAHIVGKLGAQIVAGTFEPSGMLPPEPQLLAQLGASRSVVREALRVLSEKGMLDALPKVGIRTRPRSHWNLMDVDVLNWIWDYGRREDYVNDFLEFRLTFEPMASFQAALRASPEARDEIMNLCEALIRADAALRDGAAHEQAVEADLAFHGAIFRASGNHLMSHLGAMVIHMMRLQVLATTEEPGSFAWGLPLHRGVAEAIVSGDAGKAFSISQRLVWMPYDGYVKRVHTKPRLPYLPGQREPKIGDYAAEMAELNRAEESPFTS